METLELTLTSTVNDNFDRQPDPEQEHDLDVNSLELSAAGLEMSISCQRKDRNCPIPESCASIGQCHMPNC